MTTALFGSAKKKLRRYNVPGSPCNRLRKRVCRTTPHCNYVPYRGCRRTSITRLRLPESQSEGILNDAVNTAKFKHLKEIAKNVIKKNGSHEKAVAALSESAAKMRVPQQNIERVVDDAVAIAKVEHVQNVAKSVIKNKGVSHEKIVAAATKAAQQAEIPAREIEPFVENTVINAKIDHVKEIAQQSIKARGNSHDEIVAAATKAAEQMDIPSENVTPVVNEAVNNAKISHLQNVAKSVIKNKGVSRDDALSAVEQAAQDLDIPHENVQSISDEVVATANAEQVKDIAKQAIKESGGSHTKTVAAATQEVNKIAKKSFKNKAIVLKNAGKLVKKEPVKPVNLPKKSFKQAATDVKKVTPIVKAKKPQTTVPKVNLKKVKPNAKAEIPQTTVPKVNLKKVKPNAKAEIPHTTIPKVNLKKVTPSVKAEIPHTTIPKVKLKKVTPSVKSKTPPPPPPPPPLKKVTPVAKSKKEPVTLQNVKLKKVTPSVKAKTPPPPPPPPPLKKVTPVAKSKKEPVTLENVKLKKVKPKTKQPAKKPSIADKYKTTGMDKDLAEKLARRRALSEFGKKRKTVLRKKKINNFEIKYLNNL